MVLELDLLAGADADLALALDVEDDLAADGLHGDLHLVDDDLDLLVTLGLAGAEGADEDGVLDVLGAVAGQQVEAVVHLGLVGAVVEGGDVLALNGTHGVEGLAGDELDGGRDRTVHVGQRVDVGEGVGQGDLPVDVPHVGEGGDHVDVEGLAQGVDAGANLQVEVGLAAEGSGLDGGGGEAGEEDLLAADAGLAAVPVVGQPVELEELEHVPDVGLGEAAHVDELDLVVDLVDGGGLDPDDLGQLGHLDHGGTLADQALVLLGLGGLAAEPLLLLGHLGVAVKDDLGLAVGAEAEGVVVVEDGALAADLLNAPLAEDGDGDAADQADALLGAGLGLEPQVPLLLHALDAGAEGGAVGEHLTAAAAQADGHQDGVGAALLLDVQLLEHVLQDLLALGLGAEGADGPGDDLHHLAALSLDLVVLDGLDGGLLGGVTELEAEGDLLGGGALGVEDDAGLVPAGGREAGGAEAEAEGGGEAV